MGANVIWSEEAIVDGNGPVLERPLDREVQHECSDRHQRTSAQLGRTCCQNGLLGNLREGLEMSGTSVVEMATTPLERNEERLMGLQRNTSHIEGQVRRGRRVIMCALRLRMCS